MARKPSSDLTKSSSRRPVKQGKRQQNMEQKRQQIFSGALACFEKNGYYKTTVNDIANAAGVSAGSVYQYFVDKQDLMFQVILDILEAYNRDLPKALADVTDPLERLQSASIAYFKVVNNRISASLFSYRESKSLNREQLVTLKSKELQTNSIILSCIEDCINAGYIRNIHPEMQTYWIVTAAHSWSLKNWRLRGITNFEDYTKLTLGNILNGMLTEVGKEHLKTCNLLDRLNALSHV
jgi:AcrR family transcriptional regulator